MKILVVSTPKTGNTWVKHLLASIYGLPLVDIPIFESDEALATGALDALGDAWVGHQHYAPTRALMEWADSAQVKLITCIRHPADVLVSYRHHVQVHAGEDALLGPGWTLLNGVSDQALLRYVSTAFFLLSHLSVSWVVSRRSHVIRYEDLWRDPIDTLTALCAKLTPVSADTVRRAVERCHIGMMRELNSAAPQFFRKGEVGNWRSELPETVVRHLRDVEPYPSQLAALGYTMDPADPLIADPPLPQTAVSPFHTCPIFENGVAAPAIVNHLYLSFPTAEAKARWPLVRAAEGPYSFFAWLGAGCERDPTPDQPPLISNLALYIYSMRGDVQSQFPDHFGAHRAGFALWFVRYAPEEYRLPDVFVEPVRSSIARWGDTWAPGGYPAPDAPPLNQLAVSIYFQRPDLQEAFPDLYDRDRIAYMLWFFNHATEEHRLDPTWMTRMEEHFARWAESVDPADPYIDQRVPVITRLAVHFRRMMPEIHERYPDVFGADRIDFLLWFCQQPLAQRYTRTILATWARSEPGAANARLKVPELQLEMADVEVVHDILASRMPAVICSLAAIVSICGRRIRGWRL